MAAECCSTHHHKTSKRAARPNGQQPWQGKPRAVKTEGREPHVKAKSHSQENAEPSPALLYSLSNSILRILEHIARASHFDTLEAISSCSHRSPHLVRKHGENGKQPIDP